MVRPDTISEVQAIKALRTSYFSRPARGYVHKAENSHVKHLNGLIYEEDEHPTTRADAEAMIARGWVTRPSDWKVFKKGILRYNRKIAREMILHKWK